MGFKILWIHFVPVVLMLKQRRTFFLDCPLFTNQRCTLLSTVNDIDSSLINTNDLILAHILLFGKASLDTSQWITLYQRTDLMKVFLSSLYISAKFSYLYLFFRIQTSFFLGLYIHFQLALRFSSIYLFNIFLLHSVFVFAQVSLECLRHLVIVIFCYICLYVWYSYIYKKLL